MTVRPTPRYASRAVNAVREHEGPLQPGMHTPGLARAPDRLECAKGAQVRSDQPRDMHRGLGPGAPRECRRTDGQPQGAEKTPTETADVFRRGERSIKAQPSRWDRPGHSSYAEVDGRQRNCGAYFTQIHSFSQPARRLRGRIRGVDLPGWAAVPVGASPGLNATAPMARVVRKGN